MTKTSKVILISTLVLTPPIAALSTSLILVPNPHQAYAYASDSCSLSESEIRQLWVTSRVYGGQTKDEQIETAKSLVQAAENLCRETLYSKPTPLPSELQKLTR